MLSLRNLGLASILTFATSAVTGCATASGDASSSAADTVARSDVDDTRLVSATIRDTTLHFGDTPSAATDDLEIASSDCAFVAHDGLQADFDCTAAATRQLNEKAPALAGAPLIYPAAMQGYVHYRMDTRVPDGTAHFDKWELVAHPVRIVTATKKEAVDAASFTGIGFYRMGYEFGADLLDESYNTPEGKKFYDTVRSMQQLVPKAQLKKVGEMTRASDGATVVMHEFVYLIVEKVYRPWVSPGGWAWLPGSHLLVKPFAQFDAGGHSYQNYDTRPGSSYLIQSGVITDYSGDYRSR